MKFSEIFKIFRTTPTSSSKGAAPVAASGDEMPRGYLYELLAKASPALCVATVYRCVKLLSESVAQLPIRYEKLRGGVFVPDEASALQYLLSVQPNEATSAFDFWAQVVTEVLLRGNAYIVPMLNYTTADWLSLYLVPSKAVTHDTIHDVYRISGSGNGLDGNYDESQIIHIKGMPGSDPKTGISVLTNARLTIETASIGDAETKNRFKTGGNVRGIVGNDMGIKGFGEYRDEELQKSADNLDYRFNALGEHIVALPGAVSWQNISMTSADMQFLESRRFAVRDICRFFGVHPSFVFDDTSNNYKSAEMANVAFLSNTLNPLLRKIECELLRKLVAPELAFKRRFVFDRRELFACDLESKVRYQTQTIAAGIYTVNEWRAMENKMPVEGGDKVLVSANLKGIDELTNTNTPIQDGK